MSFELVLFMALGGLAVIFAVGMLLSENAVHSALFLIGNFGCVAVLYLMLNAPFIGMVQIAVYAGAIMVLFLFVIMLLGAENTSDTSRRFRWLTGLATALAISFLFALGLPLVFGGMNLPKPEGDTPVFRVAHVAVVPENPLVKVTVSGGQLAQPLVYENVGFGAVTDYTEVTAGAYRVSLTLMDGTPIAPPANVELTNGQVVTLLASGEFNVETASFPSITIVPSQLVAETDRDARVLVYNGYSPSPISVVDLGANGVLDTRQRDVTQADGTTTQTTSISDAVVAENVPFGAVTPSTFTEGTYQLAVVDTATNVVLRVIDNYEMKRATEYALMIVPDVDAPQNTDGTYRLRVLRDGKFATPMSAPYGSPAGVGQVLFTDYLLPMNLVGILLLVALVGVIVLTRPDGEKQDRRVVQRRKVSRPLVSVIASQTGGDVLEETPKLEAPKSGE